jgi:hypothetical protein
MMRRKHALKHPLHSFSSSLTVKKNSFFHYPLAQEFQISSNAHCQKNYNEISHMCLKFFTFFYCCMRSTTFFIIGIYLSDSSFTMFSFLMPIVFTNRIAFYDVFIKIALCIWIINHQEFLHHFLNKKARLCPLCPYLYVPLSLTICSRQTLFSLKKTQVC